MDETVIRRFRRSLRQFERVIGNHNKTCCAQVTTAQCHVLLEIESAADATSSELAQRLGLDISTISRTVDSLVRMGLVARRESPGDRRSILLQLTQDGERLSRRINRDADRYFAAVLGRIPAKQRAAILEGFAILAEVLVQGEGKRAGSAAGCGCKAGERDGRA